MDGIFQSNALVEHQYSHALGKIREALTKMPDSEILANSDEDLTDHFFEEWKLEPIEEDPDRRVTATEEREMRRFDRSEHHFGPSEVEFQYAVIDLPLIPKESNLVALQLRGQTFLMSPVGKMASFRSRDHVVHLRLPLDESERLLQNLREMFGQINTDIERLTPNFRPRVLQQVKTRREQVEAHTSKFEEAMAKIGVEIARKPGAVEPVKVTERREIKLLREKPPQPAQPELEPESMKLIVGLIDQSGKGFETAPGSYAILGEEQLRDIILGHLNAVYGFGAAAGEAFSKKGKTDILLRVKDGVVLIAECKFWGGKKQYGDTIDQLFGYLTWRHTYGVLITFSKNKGLTGVVEAAGEAIAEHGTYRDGPRSVADTHLVSIHSHPDDEAKEAEVHHLFFNLYAGGGTLAVRPL